MRTLITILLSSLTSLSQSAAQTDGKDNRISVHPPAIVEAEPFIAIHPADNNKLVISYMESTNTNVGLQFPVYYSGDAGKTWTRSNFNTGAIFTNDWPISTNYDGGHVTFAWDKNGRLYMSWIYGAASFFTGGQGVLYSVYWAYSDDDGANWQYYAKNYIARGQKDIATGDIAKWFDGGICDRQWMAVDNSGGPHQGDLYIGCLFSTQEASLQHLRGEIVRVKKSGSNQFGPLLPACSGNTQYTNINVDANGTVHFTFADLASNTIRHCSSADGGASFTPAVSIGPVVNPAGTGNTIHKAVNAAVNSVLDGKGNIHVVWSAYPGVRARAFYSRSLDGGTTWSSPLDIGSKYFSTDIDAFMPTVAASGDNVSVSMYITDKGQTNYFGLNSRDNGTSFKQIVKLTAIPTIIYSPLLHYGEYNTSVRSDCTVYSAWTDARDEGRPKIYVAATNYCNLGVNELTQVNAGVQVLNIYPNPAVNDLVVHVSSKEPTQLLAEITDMTGKKLYSQLSNISATETRIKLNLAHLAKGAYILSLSDNGSLVSTRMITLR